jgi:hypothetical protein
MSSTSNYNSSNLTDDELKSRIDNHTKYQAEAIEAAVKELKSRGFVFSDYEMQSIKDNIRKDEQANVWSAEDQKQFIVDDPNAPEFYSRRAISGFTVFCGALFGSILLAVNLSKINRYKEIGWVLFFGGGFTVLQIIVGSYLNTGSSITYLTGFIAAGILEYFFWDRVIGKTYYRARPIWIPLIIAFLLCAFILASIFLQPE